MKVLVLLVLAMGIACSSVEEWNYDDSVRVPNYELWDYCLPNPPHYAYETVRTCLDNDPLVSNRGIAVYVNVDHDKKLLDKRLLISWEYERSNNIFTMHRSVKSFRVEKMFYNFYIGKNGTWKLVGQSSFIRGQSLIAKEAPLFDKNSLFGREYFALWKEKGRDTKEIEIPTVQFLE